MASGPDQAEAWLDSLAGVGWQPGLERIERLCQVLDRPQDQYRSIHVVGTNGKTSTSRSAAAILTARGVRNGCMTSPHFDSWSERVRIDGREVDREVWATAVLRVRQAVAAIESDNPEAGRVTQFEASVAAEFLTLAESGVEVAVVEAGLGGRLDATNVLSAEVVILTSVGLDHTEWLGSTEVEIATEKLAVVDPGATLVTGPLDTEVGELVRQVADAAGSRVVQVTGEGGPLEMEGAFRRLAFELAETAVQEVAGPTPEEARAAAVGMARVPGRLESLGGDPEVIFDVAHNPDGVRGLAEALPEVLGGRSVVAVFGLLSDKDPEGILRALSEITRVVFLCRPGPGKVDAGGRVAVDPSELAEIATGLGMDARIAGDPAEALAEARSEAAGRGAVVLVCGSHLLGPALQG